MINPPPVHNRGFSLVETMIYIGLSAIIVTGMLAGTYPLFVGTERSAARMNTDIESAFLTQKVIWALSTGNSVTYPLAGATSTSLTVNHPSGNIIFAPSGTGVTMQLGFGTPQELVSSRVPVTNLVFSHQAASGGIPEAITIAFDANGSHIGPTTRYVR